jgi:hypothetical protein
MPVPLVLPCAFEGAEATTTGVLPELVPGLDHVAHMDG